MNKNTKLILLFVFCSIAFLAKTQNKMIVGYLPDYRFKVSNTIDYSKLTHLNICFANPDAEGNIILSDTLQDVLDFVKIKNPSIKVFISLAGGALSKEEKANWKKHIDIPQNRPAFIAKILNYVDTYKFDGVDVDLEWRDVTEGYSDFVIELNKELEIKGVELSAALPGTHRYKKISDEAIHTFDFINLMAYDETGSWAPHLPGQHSSVNFAKKSIYFWKDSVGIPAAKLTLGLPLYAYDFTNPKKTTSHTIADIMAMDYQNLFSDSVGLIYYNGKATIEEKIDLSKNGLAGVMIWELGQDTTGKFAMLNTIYTKVNERKPIPISKDELLAKENDEFKNNIGIETYKKFFKVYSTVYKTLEVEVYDSLGELKQLKTKKIKGVEYFKIKRFKKGDYFLAISNKDYSFSKKLSLK